MGAINVPYKHLVILGSCHYVIRVDNVIDMLIKHSYF